MYKFYNKCAKRVNCVSDVKFLRTPKKFASTSNNVTDLDPGYVPSKVEDEKESSKYFAPPLKGPQLSLILPPPNITGTLHLGHALTATIQDVIVRWYRMNGYQTVWIPGTDHAGIATQVVVEKKLWNEKKQTRHDVGREDFQKLVWAWKREKEDVIGQQLRRLNVSLDWDKEVFTMDEARSKAVVDAFIKLFDSGLIYRGDHLVNWSCVLQSAISDIEVDHLTVEKPTDVHVPGYEKPVRFGVLTSFAYKFEESDEEVVVVTTRPETMLGDVAVAVNPKDGRYNSLVGKKLWHPFRRETIPIIADDFVDMNFGTGAVKITPAHDHTDFEAGKRHKLKTVAVIDEGGRLTDACGDFAGVRRFDARDVVLGRLSELGLLRGSREHEMTVPICSRSRDIVEFLVREQWFVKCQQMARRALDDVKQGRLTIEPPHFDKIWYNWLENIRDWCISRQLWWGHRIPAYRCAAPNKAPIWVAARNPREAKEKAAVQLGETPDLITVKQDDDVLDTWFSSSLLPFSALGWPNQTEDLVKHYPLTLMETGHDILFFWVARMVMLGTQLTGRLPFNKILLHGIICDAHGRKMSKSLGNVIAPENVVAGVTLQELEAASRAGHESGLLSADELNKTVLGQKKMFPQGIPECGADALRFTLCSHNIKNHFINFDVSECHTNKLFGNKIWQATKFTKLWHGSVAAARKLGEVPEYEGLMPMDKWILSRLDRMLETANEELPKYNFHFVTSALKDFLYYDFCDVYLESTKRGLRMPETDRAAGHVWTLLTCLDVGLRALAPFMPTLARHLHRSLPTFDGAIKSVEYPQRMYGRKRELEDEVTRMMEVVVAIRRLKKVFNVAAKHRPEAYIISDNGLYGKFAETIGDLSALHQIHVVKEFNGGGTVVDKIGDVTLHLVVPEELKKALEMDLPNMEKKKEKLLKELDKLGKITLGSQEKLETNAKKMANLQEKVARINYIESLAR